MTLTREGGKPLVENKDEMGWCAGVLDFYATLGRLERGRVVPSGEAGQLNLVIKEPYGVVGAIVPWNYPLLLLMWKLAPALAAGNSVIVKPSPWTPLSTLELAEGIAKIFPPGVINVVTGEVETGQALVEAEEVSMIAFTGSVDTGKLVMKNAADRLKKVHLELGGKDAFIVCEDVDLTSLPEERSGPRTSTPARYARPRSASTSSPRSTTTSSRPSWTRRRSSSLGIRWRTPPISGP